MISPEKIIPISVSLADALKYWREDKTFGTPLELTGSIAVSELKALLDLPFEVVFLKLGRTKYIFEVVAGSNEASTTQLAQMIGKSADELTLTFHTHASPDGTSLKLPSLRDYYQLDPHQQRLDLLLSKVGIYDFSWYPVEEIDPRDAFIEFLFTKDIVDSEFRRKSREEKYGHEFKVLYELSDEELEKLYQEFESKRSGPPQRFYEWNNPAADELLSKITA